jgi:hypothetical protein
MRNELSELQQNFRISFASRPDKTWTMIMEHFSKMAESRQKYY